MYPEAPSTPQRFVSIFSFLQNSSGFIDGKKKPKLFFFLFFSFWWSTIRRSTFLLDSVTLSPASVCFRCGSRTAGPAGSGTAASQRSSCRRPRTARSSTPSCSSSPSCATWRSKVSRSEPPHPRGSPTFATQQTWDPLGMIGKVVVSSDESTLSWFWFYIVCSRRVSFVDVELLYTRSRWSRNFVPVVWLELWVEECTDDSCSFISRPLCNKSMHIVSKAAFLCDNAQPSIKRRSAILLPFHLLLKWRLFTLDHQYNTAEWELQCIHMILIQLLPTFHLLLLIGNALILCDSSPLVFDVNWMKSLM